MLQVSACPLFKSPGPKSYALWNCPSFLVNAGSRLSHLWAMQSLCPSCCRYVLERGKVSIHKQSARYHIPVLLLTWGYRYLSPAGCSFSFQSHCLCCFLSCAHHPRLPPINSYTIFQKHIFQSTHQCSDEISRDWKKHYCPWRGDEIHQYWWISWMREAKQ